MSFSDAVSGTVRAILIAAVTGGAAFGLLAVLHPFSGGAPTQIVTTTSGNADTIRAKIDAAREALRQSEAALQNVNAGTPAAVPGAVTDDTRAQYEAQIAAATERRDLALRHAQAIRDALAANTDVSSLAEIRDSVVIGQLLSQQTALDAQIAEQGARFKANHPIMRALNAQKAALTTQIKAEAASIAAALESEAKLDDSQIKLLQSQLGQAPPQVTASVAPTADSTALQMQAATRRAELDSLMDAYFSMKPGSTTVTTQNAAAPGLLSPLNLAVVVIAMLAAIAFQIGLLIRRSRLNRQAADELATWHEDHDPEILREPVPVSEEDVALRKAS